MMKKVLFFSLVTVMMVVFTNNVYAQSEEQLLNHGKAEFVAHEQVQQGDVLEVKMFKIIRQPNTKPWLVPMNGGNPGRVPENLEVGQDTPWGNVNANYYPQWYTCSCFANNCIGACGVSTIESSK